MTRIMPRVRVRKDTVEREPATSSPLALRDKTAVVPPVEIRTYYDEPILHDPIWKPEIAWYFFTGGLAGASSLLSAGALLTRRPALARSTRLIAAGAAAISPPLLIADLGRPERFYNMLRVFKPTSPMNLGSWLLGAYVPAAIGAAALGATHRWRGVANAAALAAGALGPAMATYTSVLVADTAVPAWHEERNALPRLFAASSAAAAGGAAVAFTPLADASPARRLAVAGGATEAVVSMLMHRRAGRYGARGGRADAFTYAGGALTVAGTATIAFGARRSRAAACVGGALVAAGSACERFAILHAGRQSAHDPRAVIAAQRSTTST